MEELASPSTDAAVLVQVVLVVLATGVAVLAARRERSLVLLALGLGAVVLGSIGLRALH